MVTKFLPALMSLMVDDQVRHLHSKLPPDERQSAITIIEHSGKFTKNLFIFFIIIVSLKNRCNFIIVIIYNKLTIVYYF